jgi:hypothetical protein
MTNKTDRAFTHPNFGQEARVEVWGREVRLIFVASDTSNAESLAEHIVRELKKGSIIITMMGKPTDIKESYS